MNMILLFSGLLSLTGALAAPAAPPNRVGSVFSAPVEVDGKVYFVSTSGVLFESNQKLSEFKILFQGKRQTLGALVHDHGRLIWGEGLHGDQNSELHVFTLKGKKHQAVPILGHVERSVLVFAGKVWIPAGMGGLVALDSQTFRPAFEWKTYEGKPLHVDSNPIEVAGKVCVTSVYGVRGVLCVTPGQGKIQSFGPLARDPKGEIVGTDAGEVVGFATEADLVKAKFDLPSDFYVFDVKTGKMKAQKELRGFNFFAPSISGREAFITLSTGEFLLMDLDSLKISFLGEFSEPFINNSFRKGDEYCAVGVLGKFNCYLKTKGSAPAFSTDRRVIGPVIGRVSTVAGQTVIPTRMGFTLQ